MESNSEKMVYLVMGATGEYSDKIYWPVVAYTDYREADKHTIMANKRAKEIKLYVKELAFLKGFDYAKKLYPEDPKLVNEWDFNMKMDDLTGTTYFYYFAALLE